MSWAVVGPVMAPEVRWVILGWFTVSLVNVAGSRGIGFRWLVDSQLKLRRGPSAVVRLWAVCTHGESVPRLAWLCRLPDNVVGVVFRGI